MSSVNNHDISGVNAADTLSKALGALIETTGAFECILHALRRAGDCTHSERVRHLIRIDVACLTLCIHRLSDPLTRMVDKEAYVRDICDKLCTLKKLTAQSLLKVHGQDAALTPSENQCRLFYADVPRARHEAKEKETPEPPAFTPRPGTHISFLTSPEQNTKNKSAQNLPAGKKNADSPDSPAFLPYIPQRGYSISGMDIPHGKNPLMRCKILPESAVIMPTGPNALPVIALMLLENRA